MTDAAIPDPLVRSVRHELVRRDARIAGVERLTPHMIRLTLQGPELDGFASASPDDHVKLSFPQPDGRIERRDFTPRRFDAATQTLLIDFVDHAGGPAASFARAARAGDRLGVGGPRGSRVIEGQIAHWLLIGDETALPAIGRRIEEAAAGSAITAIIAVPGPADEQRFASAARVDIRWVHRPMEQAADAAPLLAALGAAQIKPGTFAWVAAEAMVARAVRAALAARGQPAAWIRAAGYWVQGEADASAKDIDAAG